MSCGSDEPKLADDSPAEAANALEVAETSEFESGSTNTPPRIIRVRFEPEFPQGGSDVRVIPEAVDADGDAIWYRYSWIIGGDVRPNNTKTLLLYDSTRGDRVQVTVIASDGKAESEPYHAATYIRNQPPRLKRVSLQPSTGITAGMTVVARSEAIDPDGDLVSFHYEWVVNDRPVLVDKPTFSTAGLRRGDRLWVEVTASDDREDSEPITTPKLTIINSPPRIVSAPNPRMRNGRLQYDVKAKDPDGDRNLQFHLEDSPDGATIDPLTGVFVWEPRPDQAGLHEVTVVVDDLEGGIDRQLFEVTVRALEEATQPVANSR